MRQLNTEQAYANFYSAFITETLYYTLLAYQEQQKLNNAAMKRMFNAYLESKAKTNKAFNFRKAYGRSIRERQLLQRTLRHLNLARGFISGQYYKAIEEKPKTAPRVTDIAAHLVNSGYNEADVEEWLQEELPEAVKARLVSRRNKGLEAQLLQRIQNIQALLSVETIPLERRQALAQLVQRTA